MGPPEPVELREGPEDAPPGWVEGWHGELQIAALVEQATTSGMRFELVARASPIDPAAVHALLDALIARAGIELVTTDPLVRDLARRHGFTGPLRSTLVPGPSPARLPTDEPDDARDALARLLPEIGIGVEANAGATRSFLRRAVSGVPRTFNLFAAPDEHESTTTFSVPRRDDLLIESVARCIDTTIGIRRRFGRVASTARRVSFDHADFQLLHGHHAGSADRGSGLIHVNASFASVGGLLDMETIRAQQSGGHGGGGGSADVPPPFNQIDGTTAHEMWHQMEGAFEARRSMDGIDLRRRLGEALGVETLEQAVNGARPRSPDAWKAAHGRLVNEVSPYGATAPIEATAEMFKLWWCTDGEPSPIIHRFGELIEPLLAAFDN